MNGQSSLAANTEIISLFLQLVGIDRSQKQHEIMALPICLGESDSSLQIGIAEQHCTSRYVAAFDSGRKTAESVS